MSKQSSNPDPNISKQPSVVIFGGTFDPIHQGHISVLQRLLLHYQCVVIAPTLRNPWKTQSPTPFNYRIEMIELVLQAENLPFSLFPATILNGICISHYPYTYVEEFVLYFRSLYPDRELTWAVGEDEATSVTKWKNWHTLDLLLEIVPITINVHSTEVRNSISIAHPAIQAYIKTHLLYNTSS